MEKESFEDHAVAEIMNKHFVCVKVDREERPDLDTVYITAVSVMTGSAGWPLNVFLTPDELKPFFGGTYFPRESMMRITGWSDLLMNIAGVWKKPNRLLRQDNRIYGKLSFWPKQQYSEINGRYGYF